MNKFQRATLKYWESIGWKHDAEDDYDDKVILSKSEWTTPDSLLTSYVIIGPNNIRRVGKHKDSNLIKELEDD